MIIDWVTGAISQIATQLETFGLIGNWSNLPENWALVPRSTDANYSSVVRSSDDTYNQVSRASDDDWNQVNRSS